MFFQSKMSCDVDGCPIAYHPDNDDLALDVIESAYGKRLGNLPSGPLTVQPASDVVVYVNGAPYIQQEGQFKGYYVSETSLENPAMPEIDPARYLDATKIPYVVLPEGLFPDVDLGDLVVVYDPTTEKYAFAIYGDEGPDSESGEASLATLQRLGLPAIDGKSSPGETRDDLLYLVFPKSAWRWNQSHQWPLDPRLIDRAANREFRKWGGVKRIHLALNTLSQINYSLPTPMVGSGDSTH